MPNIIAVLRNEITRLARKEVRSQSAGIKKASSKYRRDIAALKRQVDQLIKKVSILESKTFKSKPKIESDAAGKLRFNAKGLRSQRKRMGLSAADVALLIGVTQQSVYNWERNVSRPRQSQLAAIAALRKMGKREATARLQQMSKRK